MMHTDVIRLTAAMRKRDGCPAHLLDELEREAGFPLPADYREYMQTSNGGAGVVGASGFLRLLGAPAELLKYNADYDVAARLPGLIMFGSDGGGRAFFFDARSAQVTYAEVYWPLAIEEVAPAGDTLAEFLRHVAGE